LHFGEFEAEYVVVNASDRAGERFATIRFYDPEDVDEAMADSTGCGARSRPARRLSTRATVA